MLQLLADLQFSKEDSTQWLVLVVGVLATMYVVMRGRAKRRKDPFERPAAMGVSQQRNLERDIENLMVQMLDTARQMTAQLDTRAAKLELLIRQADERLAAIKSTGANGSTLPNSDAGPRPADESLPGESASDTSTPIPARGPEVTSEPAETPPDPRHAEIYALADSGRSPYEIARSLDRPNGEVELILALRRH